MPVLIINQPARPWPLPKPQDKHRAKSRLACTAAALGMTYGVTQQDPNGYANNYVATFLVDPEAFFRPNRNQQITDRTAASPTFVPDAAGHDAPPADIADTPWLPSLDAEIFSGDSKAA